MYRHLTVGLVLILSILAGSPSVALADESDFNLETIVAPTEAGILTLEPPVGPYPSNASVTITAESQPGFRFVRWSGDLNVATNPVVVIMDAHKSVTALFTNVFVLDKSVSPLGAGSISPTPVPAPDGYVDGTPVTLVALANHGFRFSHWTGDSAATTNRITLTMDSDKSVVAVFTNVPFYQLTRAVSPEEGGSVSVSPSSGTGDYASDTAVTLTATPNAGFRFSHWTGDSEANTNRITLVMDAEKTVTAVFTNVVAFQLGKSASPANGGSISANPAPEVDGYANGTVVTLTATHSAGFRFSHWTGDSTATVNPTSIVMDANKSVTAVFTNAATFQLNKSVNPLDGGSVSVTPVPGIDGYLIGTPVTITATAAAGFRFSHWTGDSSATTNRIILAMTANKSVMAVFTNVITYQLTKTVSPPEAGSISPTPVPAPDGYVSGTVVTLTATAANSFYKFSHWTGDSTALTNRIQLAMDDHKVVTAVFTNVPYYSLDYTIDPELSGSVTANPAPGLSGLPVGTVVTLTATPNLGFKFFHWSGDSDAATNRITFTMDTNKSFTAVFRDASIVHLTTNVSPAEAGSITRTPSSETGDYTIDTVVNVTATPNAGFRFSHWEGDSSETTNRITVTLDDDKTLTAVFTNVTVYQLTTIVSPTNGGTIKKIPGPDFDGYVSNALVGLTAQDKPGFRFSHWEGDSTATTNNILITMDGNKTVTAVFTNIPTRQLISQVSPAHGGTIIPRGTNSFEFNTEVVLSATPSNGFRFSKWLGPVINQTNYVSVKMDADHVVTAVFTNVAVFQLNKAVSPAGAGSISPTPVPDFDGYKTNTSVTLVATPVQGFKFVRWTGFTNSTSSRITFRMNGNKSVTAIFTNVPTVSLTRLVSPTNAGTISPTPTPGPNGYSFGSSVTLKAQAAPGFKFSRWAGASASTSDRITITMNGNKTITALFTNLPTFLLTPLVEPADSGSISASPYSSSNRYYAGTVVTLTAHPNGTNSFGAWVGASSLSNQATITMDGNKTVTAVFNRPTQFIFQNTTSGKLAIWFMQGTQRLSAVTMNENPGLGWRLSGAADLDLNGAKDLFFRNNSSGSVAAWLMNGNTRNRALFVNNAPVPYRVGAVADLNNDHLLDVLWQNTNGAVNIWTLGGANYITIPVGSNPGVAWRPFAAVDLDTNSSPDILFQHTDGRLAVWFMNNMVKIGSGTLRNNISSGASWRAMGATDLDADGSTDIVFQHDNGKLAAWYFKGTNFDHGVTLTNFPAKTWVLRAIR